MFGNYYQQQQPLHQHQQQYYNMPYYYPNEILYPDYTTFARPSDFNAPYQIYNYEKPVENTDYYMYAPEPQPQASILDKESPEIEEILRTNDEVWDAYKTGKFDVNYQTEEGSKKIILKEKGSSGNENDFTIRKFKVMVHTPRNSRLKDDHVLLVSFSHKSLNNKISNAVDKPRLEIEPNFKRSNLNFESIKSQSGMITGPGSEFINKIVNGDDSYGEEEEEEGVYEPAYEIQSSPSKTSSKFSKNQKKSKKFYKSSSSSSRSSSSRSETTEDEFIGDIIKQIKNSRGNESPVDSHGSKSQFSSSPQRNTPYSIGTHGENTTGATVTPVSVSFLGGTSKFNDDKSYMGSSVMYNLSEGQVDYIAEGAMGNMSRSSTRNVSTHEHNLDAQSIGPGSMAGGSLFGGYIPHHVEHANDKSGFSEFNLTKNEDGDYVLTEANGKSEIFDGKSGLSHGVSVAGSRSQISRGNESRSNMSARSSRINL